MSWIVSKAQTSIFLSYIEAAISVKRHLPSQNFVKNRAICEIWANDFLNCESTCNLAGVAVSIYGRKMDARPFDTIQDILRRLSLVQ